MEYELRDPIRKTGKMSGSVMIEATTIEVHPPKARAFVQLERKGLLKSGRETESSLEMLRLCGVPGEVVDEMSLRDLEGALAAMEAEDFFGQGAKRKLVPLSTKPEDSED